MGLTNSKRHFSAEIFLKKTGEKMQNVLVERIRSGGRSMAIAQLVAAMALAGSSVVVGKVLATKVPVFLGTFGTLLVAFLTLLPLAWGKRAEVRALDARQWGNLFLQGLFGIVVFRVFTLYGLRMTSAMQAGIITGTTPAALAALSLVLLGERLSRGALFGIACAVCGCVAINLFSAEAGGAGSLPGNLLVGAAVVSEALFTIFRKRVADSVSAVTNTAVLIFCSLLLLLPAAALEAAAMTSWPDATALLAIAYYGVFATVVAYLLWTGAVGSVSGATAGAASAAMPASAMLLAALLLGEPMRWYHLFGCTVIAIGIIAAACGETSGS